MITFLRYLATVCFLPINLLGFLWCFIVSNFAYGQYLGTVVLGVFADDEDRKVS